MDTLGIVESRSIAAGAELADAMVKAATVELLRSSPICSGRFLILVAGDKEAVTTSVHEAENSGKTLAGSFVLSHIDPQVMDALKKGSPAQPGNAIGVVEYGTVAAGIAAADAAVKRAQVKLLKLVTGQGIQGKSYFVLDGEVAAVEEAVNAAKAAVEKSFQEAVVIPRPDAALVNALTGLAR